MQTQITEIYCICYEVVKTCSIKDDTQSKMSTAEIMTFAIFSALTYGCDYRKTRLVSFHHRYFREIVSHSQIVRRMPRYIRARTEKGFCLKVLFFLLAYMLNLYRPMY